MKTVILVALLLMSSWQTAYACDCRVPPLTAATAIEQADIVAEVEIITKPTIVPVRKMTLALGERAAFIRARVRVVTLFKSPTGKRHRAKRQWLTWDATSCGFDLKKGEHVFVYAKPIQGAWDVGGACSARQGVERPTPQTGSQLRMILSGLDVEHSSNVVKAERQSL